MVQQALENLTDSFTSFRIDVVNIGATVIDFPEFQMAGAENAVSSGFQSGARDFAQRIQHPVQFNIEIPLE
jgi:hypothetical protein